MAPAAEPLARRHSRFWLFAPTVLLVLIAVGWSVAWLLVRNRAIGALDGWLALEARQVVSGPAPIGPSEAIPSESRLPARR